MICSSAHLRFDRGLHACYSHAIGRASGNKSVYSGKGVSAHGGKDCRHEPSRENENKRSKQPTTRPQNAGEI